MQSGDTTQPTMDEYALTDVEARPAPQPAQSRPPPSPTVVKLDKPPVHTGGDVKNLFTSSIQVSVFVLIALGMMMLGSLIGIIVVAVLLSNANASAGSTGAPAPGFTPPSSPPATMTPTVPIVYYDTFNYNAGCSDNARSSRSIYHLANTCISFRDDSNPYSTVLDCSQNNLTFLSWSGSRGSDGCSGGLPSNIDNVYGCLTDPSGFSAQFKCSTVDPQNLLIMDLGLECSGTLIAKGQKRSSNIRIIDGSCTDAGYFAITRSDTAPPSTDPYRYYTASVDGPTLTYAEYTTKTCDTNSRVLSQTIPLEHAHRSAPQQLIPHLLCFDPLSLFENMALREGI